MNNFKEIKLPDIDKSQIIEIRDYQSPDGFFYIHYVTYKNGIMLTNIRGLSQLSDVIAYFILRDEMVKKAGYKEYVEIRDNSGGANTTREGRAEIVRYYGRLDTRCKALIFANASMLVHLQVNIGKRIINNKHLFTTTTKTLEEGFQLAYNILKPEEKSSEHFQLLHKEDWAYSSDCGQVKYSLIPQDIVVVEVSGSINIIDYDQLIAARQRLLEDNCLVGKKVFYIHDYQKLNNYDQRVKEFMINSYIDKTEDSLSICFLTQKLSTRLYLQFKSMFSKNRQSVIFAQNIEHAYKKITDTRHKYQEKENSRILKIKEIDIVNLFNVIQKINFDFDQQLEIPVTRYKEINLIYESLALLRNDTNLYMTKLNEKIIELEDETKRRKEVEQDLFEKNNELYEAHSYIESVFNTIADGISVIDFEGRLIDCNDAYLKMFGCQRDDIGAVNVLNTYDADDRQFIDGLIANHANQKKIIFEAVKHTTFGTTIEVMNSSCVMPSLNQQESFIVTILKDISEQKSNQKKLKQQNALLQSAFRNLQQSQDIIIKQEKLASLGTMVAGIAHEINNPTQAIKFSIESLGLNIKDIKAFMSEMIDLMHTTEPAENEKLTKIRNLMSYFDVVTMVEEIGEFIKSNLQSVQRIEHIINSSKRMAYAESIFAICNMNQIIEDALTLVANQIKYNVTIQKNLARSLPDFNGLSQELGQVIINLLINGKDAIEEKGLNKDDGIIQLITLYDEESNRIEIRISDNGKGIKAENITKIFDPFFTTKAVGKGTGLGLNLVHRIIESHKGEVKVESIPDQGTTFIIHLPVIKQRSSTKPSTP